ncbi:MAG TPA: tRNA preQ1(34) S-adenosylmethionine ribosyltransferase-isomerase QueA [Vicinamibacterales bacterium]
MLVRDFDFDLPHELIAQEPTVDRSGARLLVLPRTTGPIDHSTVKALPSFLQPGDLLVVNNTRVFPARLLGHRVPSGGAVECLLVALLSRRTETEERWEALVHPGQKLKPGSEVVFEGAVTVHGEILERRFFGRRTIRLWTDDGSTVQDAIEKIGHVPLPPYIKRDDRAADRDRYQTVFAERSGSIAAPTAGLHFSAPLITALREQGVEIVEITLHVGYGTFQPVRVERVEEHRVEAERYEISDDSADAINRALEQSRRVIAVGTTATRTLESVAHEQNGQLVAGGGTTGLFIYPGFEFKVISGLLTNFHLPQSSLLMLVCAFAGRERVLSAYREAVNEKYRFYSYGDAMLIV